MDVMRKKAALLTLLFHLLMCFSVIAQDPTAAQESAHTERYVYKQTPEGELELFVHLPNNWEARDKRPAIVFFFGGAWRTGTVKEFLPHAEYLAGRGMVTVRADYRVMDRHGTMPDKCIEDAKSAVRWLRANATRLGIDPKRIAASGHSAGGTLSICAFATIGMEAKGEDLSISSKPNLLLLFNTPLSCNYKYASYLGSKEMILNLFPNLTKGVPPTILFYGKDDFRHLLDGLDFVHESKRLGNIAELYAAEGQDHNFSKYSPWLERTLYLMDQFLAKYGYVQGKPTIELPEGKIEMGMMNPDSLILENTLYYTPLHRAARNGDTESVKALIARGANVSALDMWGNTPMHYAVWMSGDVELLQILIVRGADLNVHDKLRGKTPLHLAAYNGDRNVVDILITGGADLNVKNLKGETPLDSAMSRNLRHIVKFLLAKGASLSIHTAVQLGNLAKVKVFVEEDADINVKDDSGFTPLHYAARGGHKDIAEFLIANGAGFNTKNNAGQAPIDVAVERNHRNLVQLLVAKGAEISTIHLAAYLGDITKVQSFIEKGIDVNITRGPTDETSLHYAVKSRYGSVDVIKLLVDSGADINSRNRRGGTPLHYAARYSSKDDIFQLLVSKGADADIKNNLGQTPKNIVAMRRKFRILIICAVVMPLVVGFAGAIPIARCLHEVSGRSKRFFCYFGLLIGVYLVEYLTCCAVTIILFKSRSRPPSEFVWGLASMGVLGCVWGIFFGIWLRRRATARKIMKAVIFVSFYASVPIICLTILSLVELIIIEGVNIASVEKSASQGLATMPWLLNTVLGYSVALVLGVILLKTAIMTGEVGLLIRFRDKSSKKDQTKY